MTIYHATENTVLSKLKVEYWQIYNGFPAFWLAVFSMAQYKYIFHINNRKMHFCSFLETENMRHCVPSSVSSGLAKLPLDYVYENGTRTNERTSKKLPLGEPLDGRKAYESIMPYFTTITKTPDEVHQLGKDMLNKLYPEVCFNLTQSYVNAQNEIHEMKLQTSCIKMIHIHHLRAYHWPTQPPAPSWPYSSTGRALLWHCRGHGSRLSLATTYLFQEL